jgi:hypothetical protein
MIDLAKLFCTVVDFWKNFENLWDARLLAGGKQIPRREPSLCLSEVMTLVILFPIVGYRNFKNFYIGHVLRYLKKDFPDLPSYNRFVELKSQLVFPLHCYLMSRLGNCTGVSFIDSASLEACHPKRVHSHRVFKGIAKWGKISVGYFYGFKLHIVVNDAGELLAYMFTGGNIDDSKLVPKLMQKIFSKVFGDKGYISSDLFA